ncbi:MAG: hypothetical protein JWM68_4035 [Verrucomicrobiales bacterium]|nr:hypothetical protein [Verrucomicrobiales bacterium]
MTKFAVLQRTLEVPPIETLKRAFRRTTFLVPLDAFGIARDAFGILVRSLSQENAVSLQSALLSEGIETDVVAEENLVPSPPTKFTNRLDCTPEGLMVYDPIGRGFVVEWQHVMLVAAGNVLITELKRVEKPRPVPDEDTYRGYSDIPVTEYSTKEEQTFRFMLEIVLARAVLRYSLNVNSRIPFRYLGERMKPDLSENLSMVIQDMCNFAPHLAFNRGAYYFREHAAEPFSYPSKNAFSEETTWLLWQMKQAGKI